MFVGQQSNHLLRKVVSNHLSMLIMRSLLVISLYILVVVIQASFLDDVSGDIIHLASALKLLFQKRSNGTSSSSQHEVLDADETKRSQESANCSDDEDENAENAPEEQPKGDVEKQNEDTASSGKRQTSE